MSDAGRGLPLLSGPPPDWHTVNEAACRKCNKEFNLLFARSRKCNHCGYSYCHSCTDFQALMPRRGSESGYDPVPVCAFCIEFLQITASGKGQLKQVPMAKLKRYAKAYNINVDGVIEKDEFVDRLIAARGANGCLPPANETYYRKYSVPNRSNERPRGLFTRAMDAMGGASGSSSSQTPPPRQHPQSQSQYAQRPPYTPRQRTTSGPSRFPRPDLDPRAQQQQQPQYHRPQQQQGQQQYHWQAPRPAPPQSQSHSRPQQHYAPPPGYPPGYTPSTRPDNLHVPPAPSGRPRSASATGTPRARSPAPPPVEVPSIDALLEMSDEQIARLSVGVLKEILFKNHVNARLVVEKSELVARVRTLLEEERAERERHARAEEEERLHEEEMRRAQEESVRESQRRAEQQNEQQTAAEGSAAPEAAASESQTGDAAGATGGDTQGQSAGESIPNTEAAEGSSAAPPPSTPPKAAASPPPVSALTPKAQAMASRLERTGLCVICQDEEANIAIVDCGHLALCRGCSDLIMKSTRECPLCRTRIVTESRLLRIFKA
ncbi:hypothetical protein OH77DRAFT_1414525 [Trametes cingulata]|nr:hypothetical protein OH77DRAFT_1414525 [Trametes cingulata]